MVVESGSVLKKSAATDFCFDRFRNFSDDFILTRHIKDELVSSKGFAQIDESYGKNFRRHGFLELNVYSCSDHRKLTEEFLWHISDLHEKLQIIREKEYYSKNHGRYVKKEYIYKLENTLRKKIDSIVEKIVSLELSQTTGEKSRIDDISIQIKLFTLQETSSFVSNIAKSVIPSRPEILNKLCSTGLPDCPAITINVSSI